MKNTALLLQFALISGVLTLSLVSWFRTLGALFAGGLFDSIRRWPIRVPPAWGAADLLVNVLIYVLLSLGAIEAVRQLNPEVIAKVATDTAPSRLSALPIFVMGIAQIAAVVLGSIFVAWRAGPAAARSIWDCTKAPSDLILAFYAFGLVIVPVFIIQAVLVQVIEYEHPAITPFQKSKDWVFFASAAFSAVIAAPLAEEYFFRGLLQGWLERFATIGARSWDEVLAPPVVAEDRFPAPLEIAPPTSLALQSAGDNPYAYEGELDVLVPVGDSQRQAVGSGIPHWPLWAVSGIFALLHAQQGPAPVPLFFFSIAMGYVYRHTGRILPCLIMHFLLNGISMAMLALSTLTTVAK